MIRSSAEKKINTKVKRNLGWIENESFASEIDVVAKRAWVFGIRILEM